MLFSLVWMIYFPIITEMVILNVGILSYAVSIWDWVKTPDGKTVLVSTTSFNFKYYYFFLKWISSFSLTWSRLWRDFTCTEKMNTLTLGKKQSDKFCRYKHSKNQYFRVVCWSELIFKLFHSYCADVSYL